MAVDKLVDSTQLDADLTSVANAIRTKGGTSAQMAFPAGFVSAIQNIPGGDENLSILKQITHLKEAFSYTTISDFDLDFTGFNNLYDMSFMFMSASINSKTVKIRNLVSQRTNFNVGDMFYYSGSGIKRIEFINCNFAPAQWSEFVRTCQVEEIIGDLDFSNASNVGAMFWDAPRLKEVRFRQNTVTINMSNSGLEYCALLSDASLISIANGLSPNATSAVIPLHTTPKSRCSEIMGTNDNGTFIVDLTGALSLADFITNVKGWTIA